MFYDTLLQNTRILAAWDQFKTSGPNPSGLDAGAYNLTVTDRNNCQAKISFTLIQPNEIAVNLTANTENEVTTENF